MKKYLRPVGGSAILALLLALLIFRGYKDNWGEFLISYAWSFALCITQWLGHDYIYDLLDRRISWREKPVKRAAYGSLAIILYAVAAFMVVHTLMYRIVYGAFPENPFIWALKSSYVAIFISFSVSLVLLAIGFFKSWKMSLLEAEHYEKEMLKYRFESLQKQINPHFLFNSFNVLSDLVYEDQAKAVRFIGKMSQLFRYVLDNNEKELVTVSEEMEFARSYLFLLQNRFENKLQVEMDLQTSEEEMLVPMTLQLLIENCVKHNEVSAGRPLRILISRKDEYLTVENNLQPISDRGTSSGMGLKNLQQQYQFFTGRTIRRVQTDRLFRVEIPILEATGS